MAGDTYVPRRPPELPRSTPRAPRRTPPTPRWVFHARRIGALLILVLLIAGIARACSGGEEPGTGLGAEPGPAPTTTTTAPTPPQTIDAARPTEMRIPAVGLTAKFESGDCRVVDGAVDPGGLSKACAYTAPDKPYQLPGSQATDIVVLAGHAAAGVPAVFDKLYDAPSETHTVSIGDALYIRTELSGEWWLKYVATDLHDPMKDALAGSAEVWGTEPTPGRLLTISCVQPANPFEDSVRNAVVGWRYEGIVADPA